MFKRLFWLSVGTLVGFGGSIWAQRRIRQQVQRLAPDRVARQVAFSVRRAVDDVRDAAREGQRAMREREAALRAELQPPGS